MADSKVPLRAWAAFLVVGMLVMCAGILGFGEDWGLATLPLYLGTPVLLVLSVYLFNPSMRRRRSRQQTESPTTLAHQQH